jgi:hypothetical protein
MYIFKWGVFVIKIKKSIKQIGNIECLFDEENELSSLPTDCEMGSTAFCIETSMRYIFNGNSEWVEG